MLTEGQNFPYSAWFASFLGMSVDHAFWWRGTVVERRSLAGELPCSGNFVPEISELTSSQP